MIEIGERVPEATLYEYLDAPPSGCAVGPNAVRVSDLLGSRRMIVFGLPGAFTPTCSERHVPGFVTLHAEFMARGIDQVACVSVNDAFVMNAWGRSMQVEGKIRMLADGNAEFTQLLGLELDLRMRGMGLRSQRYAMLVDAGTVVSLHVEGPGKFELSSAEAMLARL